MAYTWRESREVRGKVATPPLDAVIAGRARDQYGVVSRAQLRSLGLSTDAIDRRVAPGRLHPIHRGVYAVGHTLLTERGRWTAAVLACGDRAALFGASAAALWDIRRSDAAWIDVVVPTDAGRAKRSPIRVHRVRTLRPDEVIAHHGIGVTTPARTILDLAATLSRDRLERALDRTTDRERRRRGRRGRLPLRAAAAHRRDRQLALPQDPARLRRRPRPRRAASRTRLPHRPHHRPPARERPGRNRQNPPNPG
jgi:hypothetical protein